GAPNRVPLSGTRLVWRMSFSENRYPLFRDIRYALTPSAPAGGASCRLAILGLDVSPLTPRTPFMIDLYYWTTPNGHKITIFLEETGLPYKIFPINIGKGEQFKPDFLAISPNNRIPAMVDHDPPGGGKPVEMMES